MPDREGLILKWLERLERSELSAPEFFATHRMPFSLAQYYRYRTAFAETGILGIVDGRSAGNHRRLHAEAEGFLRGYASAHPEATQPELQQAIHDRFEIQISQSGMSRCLDRLGIKAERTRRPTAAMGSTALPYAGFELVVGLAWHFGWPQWTGEVIEKAISRARKSQHFAPPEQAPDLRGRNRRGQFTARYNRRRDVRVERFQSIDVKRGLKSLESMDLTAVDFETLARKCLAVLTLPFVTLNGAIRSVDTAIGQALEAFCGFQYKQVTLSRFLSELKYLGLSEDLLRQQVGFWQEIWRDSPPIEENLAILCYYVDGNTKALWSTKRVKKHKVTMLGRVMGCLEQVFVHDSHGRPIYFETYSGHAPMGEYILSLFEKIEDSLEGPGPRLPVNRAIVMDAAYNGVRTLRAFASQKKYHYITSLDDNQWDPRKIRTEGRPQRYRYGPAMLQDCEIELEDSQEKGYLFATRAIAIDWDRGKKTYLTTSFPKDLIGASGVVKAYFDRWPDEELPFRVMKAVACLNRVAGYGKQVVPDRYVQKRQAELASQIAKLEDRLSEPRRAIAVEEAEIVPLIPTERRLRARSRIVDGRRILPRRQAEELQAVSARIAQHERKIKAIRKANPEFKRLERAERQYLRLQGKETVYQVDVELDQIMTYFRVSLVNLYTYLARLMNWSHLSLVTLIHNVLFLTGRVEETPEARRVILRKNQKAGQIMDALSKALVAINALDIHNIAGQKLTFGLE